ncbi:AgmX/PglI C-terminal domain-containing protein [Microvenator marinus]|uniref:AgmX/PglI C-terminal domain-containing protein n=1 Tax=Microvenator marinus TaxID=2600177 RepID=A0A5B8XYE1_9DELT|nr:AgmX/PglI C-terminal domain-containing protein [Microvenator marinus]QED30241.1 AgmX/PglI C-terminal domain-containing protein [Microvenator marinus]
MSQILAKYGLLEGLAKHREVDVWFVQNLSPGYDEARYQVAYGFGVEASGHPALAALLDYETAVSVQLRHPQIEPTVGAGRDGSHTWFVHEVRAGESLHHTFRTLQERGYPTLTVPLALAIAKTVCDALHAAHTAKNAAGWSLNACHGGFDLTNVKLTYEGEIHLQGFGSSKIRRQATLMGLGSLGRNRLGYISPEEVSGKPADVRSDVYSVGVLLWEVLTGETIFQGTNFKAEIVNTIPARPSSLNSKVTPALDALVLRALSKNPAERFQNCEHMGLELGKLVGDVSKALERVPRVLEQLFPERKTDWQRFLSAAYSGKSADAAGLAAKLLGRSDNEDTQLKTVSQDDLRQTAEADAHLQDELLRASLSGRPLGPGWESAPIGEAASMITQDWAEESIPRMDRQQQLDPDQSTPVSTAVWEDDLQETIPGGVPAPAAAPTPPPEPEPELPADPALIETHLAYKPTPIPEEVATHMAYKPSPMPGDSPEAKQAPAVQPLDAPIVSQELNARGPEPEELPPFEDEDEEEAFVEPFDVDLIVAAPELAAQSSEEAPVLEIIRTSAGKALDIEVLRHGLKRYKRVNSGVRARKSGKKAVLSFKEPVQGWLRRARNPRETLGADKKLVLEVGDVAQFEEGDITYHVRFFRPQLPPKGERQLVSAAQIKIYAAAIAISLVMHGLGGVGALLTSHLGVELTVKKPDQIEVFAEGTLEKPKPAEKKPKPPPKVEKPKPQRIEPKPPSDPTEAQAKIPKSVREVLDKRLKSNPGRSTEEKADSLISALTTPVKGDGATIQDVVTNIDAVARPGASNAAFNVTGTLGKIEGGGVNIATSKGGSKIGDIGGAVSTNVGKLDKREGAGKIRGKANAVRALSKVQGTLSQGEVYNAIQKHIGKIQACYERELNKNPSLGGKLQYEWTIKTNGRVGVVKEIGSTMGNATVSKCVTGVIRKIQFPKPKGGEVIVTYPLVFSASN